jgi:hypothetical protein
MDGSRNERARARAISLLAQIAPRPDDSELQRMRELALDYIREAERREIGRTATRESREQTSAVLDAIARDYFARALRNEKWLAASKPNDG